MDLHAALETFAEAWVVANTQTAVNTDPQFQTGRPSSVEDLPTLLPKDQITYPQQNQYNPALSKSPSQQPFCQPGPSGSAAKSIPIHCIIEQVQGGPHSGDSLPQPVVELDSYAIIPTSTPFVDIVQTALTKLGYSATEAMGALGTIQIKNWKPLTFDMITDNKEATTEDILAEITNMTTLKIRISSKPSVAPSDDMKDKLLQLLLTRSQGLLLSSGCPIDKETLNLISKGQFSGELSKETKDRFYLWYIEQLEKNNSNKTHLSHENKELSVPSSQDTEVNVSSESTLSSTESSTATNKKDDEFDELSHNSVENEVAEKAPDESEGIHPALVGCSGHGKQKSHHPYSLFPYKPRERTFFDPELEIPRLQYYYSLNSHPSRAEMENILEELNSLETRKFSHKAKKLDLTNIIYWFKNARAAAKRISRAMENEGEELSPECQNKNGESPNEKYNYPETLRKSDMNRIAPILRESIKGNVSLNGELVPVLPNRNAVYVTNPMLLKNDKADIKEGNERSRDQPLDFSTKKETDNSQTEIIESHNDDEMIDGSSRAGNKNDLQDTYVLAEETRQIAQAFNIPVDRNKNWNIQSEGSSEKDLQKALENEASEPSPAKRLKLNTESKTGDQKEKLETSQETIREKLRKSESENESSDRSTNASPEQRSEPSDPLNISIKQEKTEKESFSPNSSHPSHLSPGNKYMSLLPNGINSIGMLQRHSDLLSMHLQNSLTQNGLPASFSPQFQMNAERMAAYTKAQIASSAFHPPLYAQQYMNSQGQDEDDSYEYLPNGQKKRRTRVFIDPVTEISRLEKWFQVDSHPTMYAIEQFTHELNKSEYRQKFPKLTPRNVQLWFKNHRAKVKREKAAQERISVSFQLPASYVDITK